MDSNNDFTKLPSDFISIIIEINVYVLIDAHISKVPNTLAWNELTLYTLYYETT